MTFTEFFYNVCYGISGMWMFIFVYNLADEVRSEDPRYPALASAFFFAGLMAKHFGPPAGFVTLVCWPTWPIHYLIGTLILLIPLSILQLARFIKLLCIKAGTSFRLV